ncbi:MAG TPA: COX15/CtaA family protein [Xanthobacteraceae bacterium]|nr:COX15/CtaA family protein [Xanthobacteraceae bacterium]
MVVAEFPFAVSARAESRAAIPRAVRQVQVYFAAVFVLSLGAFVLGVEGRFPGGLFAYPPPVDWIPPLSSEQWLAAFTLHQQDPIYAACGGSQSLGEFQTLYWWEWARRASALFIAAAALAGLTVTSSIARFRFAFGRIVGLCLIVAAYGLARWLVGLAATEFEELARYNVGQYRHVVDVTFASAVVAAVLASAFAPPQPRVRARVFHLAAWLWAGALLIDIAFGALFMARDAAAVWSSWAGLGDVPLDRFVGYRPLWLNFVFNPYTIQLVHRALSAALWIAAFGYLAWSIRRNRQAVMPAAALFGLLTVEMAIGAAALVLGVPPALSPLHRIGGVVLLAVAFTLSPSPRPWPRRSPATLRTALPAS